MSRKTGVSRQRQKSSGDVRGEDGEARRTGHVLLLDLPVESACQPPSDGGINCPPSHGRWLDALRPAWASCITIAAFERLRTDSITGFSAASVASFHSPRQPGVMRPIASTAGASMQKAAAPDSASELIWVKCQSLASPFSAEYWHIGATMMRLGSVRPRSVIGENRALMGDFRWGED